MSLTKDDPEVGTVKSLVDSYGMPIFAVDMIKDAYSTDDAFEVARLLDEIFDVTELTIEDIMYLLLQKDGTPNERFSLCMGDIF